MSWEYILRPVKRLYLSSTYIESWYLNQFVKKYTVFAHGLLVYFTIEKEYTSLFPRYGLYGRDILVSG